MTNFPHTTNLIEIEAKFPGGKSEFVAITEWLQTVGGFEIGPKHTVQRVHLYFDDCSRLQDAGCRLRCIVAPGGGVRYDFKADDLTGGRETLELSKQSAAPVRLEDVVSGFLNELPEGGWHDALSKASQNDLRIDLAMTGTHVKAIAKSEKLELELSWDSLSAVDSGKHLSEIEVELLSGGRSDYEECIERLQHELVLRPETRSKLERMKGK